MGTRRLAAIAVLDTVGYSRLMAEDELGTHATLLAHRDALEPILLNHGGRIVKGTGDGLLVEVPSAVAAVAAAVEGQHLMADRNGNAPEGRRMHFRIGINLGDVIVEDDGDIYGDGVNVAARIEALADPGGICVSQLVRDQVDGRLDCSFEPMGEVEVKNIPRPVTVYRVVFGSERTMPERPASVPTAVPTIAVLPFDNMSGGADQDYFADGITEDLITALSHHRDLRVVARTSTFVLKGRGLSVREAARQLDATYVVEGSVRRAGDRVRVAAQLIEAETGHHVWADRFDRDLDDIFEVQDEIVHEIAGHVHPTLEKREARKLGAMSADELSAWDLVLRGRAADFSNTEAGLREAVRLYELAAERDPTWVVPHAHLAGAWITAGFNRWNIDGRHPFIELFAAAAQAYERDPTDGYALNMQALALLFQGHYDAAAEIGRRALATSPYDPMSHTAVGLIMLFRGDTEPAVENFSTAWRLARHEPFRFHIATNLAFAHYLARRYEAAWAWAQRGLESASYLQSRAVSAAALAQLGRIDEAQRHLRYVLESRDSASATSFLRNIRWEHASDIEHYREGLIAAGLPE